VGGRSLEIRLVRPRGYRWLEEGVRCRAARPGDPRARGSGAEGGSVQSRMPPRISRAGSHVRPPSPGLRPCQGKPLQSPWDAL